jgi:hypothetical protein
MNGYPLIYPDSVDYLATGPIVARALFLHKFAAYYGMRSMFYSLGILPWHCRVTPWSILVLNAGLVLTMVWLVMRTFSKDWTTTRCTYLLLGLGLLTTLSWFVSLIMPDILASLLCLCIYLLVFANETLSRVQHWGVVSLTWFAITAHLSHLILYTATCLFLISFWVIRSDLVKNKGRQLVELIVILIVAVAAQEMLHFYLYGQPSLSGERPPYLMARIIADGPGLKFLQSSCPRVDFTICRYVDELPTDPGEFLWKEGGIWDGANDETAKKLRDEEVAFVLATFRRYPRDVVDAMIANFREQLFSFDLSSITDVTESNHWIAQELDNALPSGSHGYLHGLQAKNLLTSASFSAVNRWTVLLSIATVILTLPLRRNRTNTHLLALTILVFWTVIANAAITGCSSNGEDRYQARVVWLIPFLGALSALHTSIVVRPEGPANLLGSESI